MLDEHLRWTNHIATIENKISKYFGLLYKAKRVLNKNTLKRLYFSFIHSYLNYGNIVWASVTQTKLKKLDSKHKQAIRVFENENCNIKESIIIMKILNIYKLNIYQLLNLMHRIKIILHLLFSITISMRQIIHIRLDLVIIVLLRKKYLSHKLNLLFRHEVQDCGTIY